MLNDVKNGIWSELSTKTSIDIYRRNLQKLHIETLIALISPPPSASATPTNTSSLSKVNDARSILRGHIKSLSMQVKGAEARMTDASSRLHLQDVYSRLSRALTIKDNGE